MTIALTPTNLIQLCNSLFTSSRTSYRYKHLPFTTSTYYRCNSTIIFSPVTDISSNSDSDYYNIPKLLTEAKDEFSNEKNVKSIIFFIAQELPRTSGLFSFISQTIPLGRRNHFVLLHFDLQTKAATLIDSFQAISSSTYDCYAVKDQLIEGLDMLSLEINGFEVVNQGVQPFFDWSTCGIWAFYNALMLARNNFSIAKLCMEMQKINISELTYKVHSLLQGHEEKPTYFFQDNIILSSNNQESAASKIQSQYRRYNAQKNFALHKELMNSSKSKLFLALNMRFQCMRAVACAKFSATKSIEDPKQAAKVISSIQEFARAKGFTDTTAITKLFYNNIKLAENIQTFYCQNLWEKSGYNSENKQKLVHGAYQQLCELADNNQIAFAKPLNISSYAVLSLARKIISNANERIVNALTTELEYISKEQLSDILTRMLKTYMQPKAVSANKNEISELSTNIINSRPS